MPGLQPCRDVQEGRQAMSGRPEVVAWDIGGAHLKFAHLGSDGRFQRLVQQPAPSWQEPRHLALAMGRLSAPLPPVGVHHCVTLTAELADYWCHREAGLAALLDRVQDCLSGQWLRFYAGPHGLLAPDAVRSASSAVMSANWHATAQVAARHHAAGVLLDIGSTTSDLIPFADGSVRHRGYLDQERLCCDELVYTGVIRSSVMSLSSRVPFFGVWQGLANEHFATTADIYRITGQLPEADDMQDTADQGGKSLTDSLCRLARMVGTDYHGSSKQGVPRWALQDLARYLAECQLQKIDAALSSVLSRRPRGLDHGLIGAGCGAFLVAELAARQSLPYLHFAELLAVPKRQYPDVARVASACALAFWTQQQLVSTNHA